ncbi:MAG TPA: glucosaminidase domain-containing protein [Thermomicrobiales bacterium]|nr:glucosaminidase domain-containing protein [Thermomicrobiales bacterium]
MSGIPVRGQARGSADAAFAAARKRGCQRLDFTRDYFTALYRDAATLGIDADVLVGQWSLETGDGTSTYWIEDGNPGGLAAFDDGSNWGLTFSPEKAARAHAVHMARYLGSTNVPDDWIATDARWQAVADAGYVGTVTTTDDLGNGRWATDPQYASKLRSRYVAYWGEPGTTPVQPAGGTDVAITFGNVPIFGHTDRYISD